MDDVQYAYREDLDDVEFRAIARREVVRQMLAAHPPGSPGPVLDIGCGSGALLRDLSGPDGGIGTDLAPGSLEAARRRGLRDLAYADCTSMPFEDRSFATVTAIDVIEHIPDDLGALREVRRVCQADGTAILVVPCHMWLWSERDIRLHHQRRYSLGSFTALVRKAGLRVLRASYLDLGLLPVLAGMVLTGRAAAGPNGAAKVDRDTAMGGEAVNRALLAWSRVENRALRYISFPIGISALVVARPG